MRALILAGGAGSRLGPGEKPLTLIAGRPMIAYVVEAFRTAGCEPVVAVSPRTPMTANWCRALDVPVCRTGGGGFVEDMVQAVRQLEESGPVFVSVSDIPCIRPGVIAAIREAYTAAGRDALSTWIPERLVMSGREGMPYRLEVNGVAACPAGINILRGDRVDEPQEEYALLLDEPCLAINVNMRADRARAESFLKDSASRA